MRSGNVQHLATKPGTAGISGCFMKTAPLFVTSGLESVRVWNVKDATNPTQVGVLPNAVFENEAMNCGERRTDDGKRQVRADRRRPVPGVAELIPSTSMRAATSWSWST